MSITAESGLAKSRVVDRFDFLLGKEPRSPCRFNTSAEIKNSLKRLPLLDPLVRYRHSFGILFLQNLVTAGTLVDIEWNF